MKVISVAVCFSYLCLVPASVSASPLVAAIARVAAPGKQTAGKVHQATGEILALSPASLLLLHARGRTKQKMEFILTPETRKTVALSKGERVVVFYREAAGRRTAMRIRAAAPARAARRHSAMAKPKS